MKDCVLLYTVLISDNDTKKQPWNNPHICRSHIFPGQINKLPHVLFLIPQILFLPAVLLWTLAPGFFRVCVSQTVDSRAGYACVWVRLFLALTSLSEQIGQVYCKSPTCCFHRVSLQRSLKIYGGEKAVVGGGGWVGEGCGSSVTELGSLPNGFIIITQLHHLPRPCRGSRKALPSPNHRPPEEEAGQRSVSSVKWPTLAVFSNIVPGHAQTRPVHG